MAESQIIKDYSMSSSRGSVLLPEPLSIDGADFERKSRDLIVYNRNGARTIVRNYFSHRKLPPVVDSFGARMFGELIEAFVHLSPDRRFIPGF